MNKIVILLKKIVISFFKSFNIRLSIHKINKYSEYEDINKYEWQPFVDLKENYYLKIYFDGLRKSKSTNSDNIFKQLRFYTLFQLVKYSIKKNNEYNFAECGCWKGHSSYSISKILIDNNFKNKFYIFDSFEGGLSNQTQKDINNSNSNINTSNFLIKKKYFSSNYEDVKNVLKNFSFIEVYKTWIPNKFELIKDKQFQFVHIDVDLYQPTLDALKFFYPKLVKGGILVCDDYNSTEFPGAKKAWDEYFTNIEINFFHETVFGGCYLIK